MHVATVNDRNEETEGIPIEYLSQNCIFEVIGWIYKIKSVFYIFQSLQSCLFTSVAVCLHP